MSNNVIVIGDVHGCGLEVKSLIDKSSPDKVIFVGDLFDRAIHSFEVWKVIQDTKAESTRGNHEQKILNWLEGTRAWLPKHYYWALNNLIENGVTPQEIYDFIKGLPLIISFDNIIVTHAAVDLNDPYMENLSTNVYGNMKGPMPIPQEGDGRRYFWDYYDKDPLVLYGHLVTDGKPRYRKSKRGQINSVGLDTFLCHGGWATGINPYTMEIYQEKAQKDWHQELCQKMGRRKPEPCEELIEFRNQKCAVSAI